MVPGIKLTSPHPWLDNIKTTGVEECYYRCRGTQHCVAFTWFTFQHNQKAHCVLMDKIGDHKEDEFAISGRVDDCPLPVEPPTVSPNYWTGEPGEDWTMEEALIVKAKLYMLFTAAGTVINEYMTIYPEVLRPSGYQIPNPPKVLRLGFHSCLRYSDGLQGGGCDGCLNPDGMGNVANCTVHDIKVTTDQPVRSKPYPLPHAVRATVSGEVKNVGSGHH